MLNYVSILFEYANLKNILVKSCSRTSRYGVGPSGNLDGFDELDHELVRRSTGIDPRLSPFYRKREGIQDHERITQNL